MSSPLDEKVSHLLDDDDDDDSLVGLSRLEDAPPKTGAFAPPSRTSEAPRDKPATVGAPPQLTGQSRINHYRALQGFLQAMCEAAPLYLGERSRHPELSDVQLQQKVGQFCRQHLALVDRCFEINNADPTDIMLRYQRRALARNLSSLYVSNTVDEIQGIVEVAHEWAAQDSMFEQAGSEEVSSDNLLNVKMALFSSTLRAQSTLKRLNGSAATSKTLEDIQRIALALAKEIAFNWSKRAQISDRENLLLMAIPHCVDITTLAWKDLILSELPEPEYLIDDDAMPLPLFETAVLDMDMGYIGAQWDALKARMSRLARNHAMHSDPDLEAPLSVRWKSALVASIDSAMADCWNEASQRLLHDLQRMSPEDRQAFAVQHEVMEETRFTDLLTTRLDALPQPLSDVDVDVDQVERRARRHLAWVWGLSDSLIVARHEGLPEDAQ